jgi:EAL domain-containing protein (putative c-di-GMP-specific phosphodiesterase class I)/FixJ family two-component response regulator
MRVLVFDDEDSVGRAITKCASAAGIDAAAVTDAASFAGRLRSDPPHVVILDLQLGSTDGVAQLRMLAERKFAGSVVLMSGFDPRVLATARVFGQSLGLEVADVMEKPLRLAQIEEVLERLRGRNEPLALDRIRQAIANDEMTLDFQPVVTGSPKSLWKLEALVRWDHPTMGRIPPGDFLPIAESDAATVDALSDWVLAAAVEAYQVLAEVGVSVPLAVNISAQNLRDLSLPDRIERRLRAGNMPAQHLHIEITETAAFTDAVRTMDILSRLRLKGIELSLDDFGTGYSSLKMLQQMPFSEIKIDQSFVKDVSTSRDSRAIVKSIIDLANNMDLSCVAEGVESEEIAHQLMQLGVNKLQGYHIARPMPVEALANWSASWTGAVAASRPDQHNGKAHGTPGTTERAVAAATNGAERHSDVIRLPPRQLQVMQLLAQGLAVKEIARQLGLGTGTVKVHLSLAYSALGARNRIEAIQRAGLLLRPAGAAVAAEP